MNKMPRRKFIQLSAVAAAAPLVYRARPAEAQDLPKLSVDDPMAQSLNYVNDASKVDPADRPNPAPEQQCSNCALVQGEEGEWRQCQIFPGKLVNANGWCSVWAPKA